MRQIEHLPSVSTFISDNSRIPVSEQIQIDFDRYENGQIFELKIRNAIACAMSEYKTTIKFLERLPREMIVTLEVKKFIDELITHLKRIEFKREKSGGRPLVPQP